MIKMQTTQDIYTAEARSIITLIYQLQYLKVIEINFGMTH